VTKGEINTPVIVGIAVVSGIIIAAIFLLYPQISAVRVEQPTSTNLTLTGTNQGGVGGRYNYKFQGEFAGFDFPNSIIRIKDGRGKVHIFQFETVDTPHAPIPRKVLNYAEVVYNKNGTVERSIKYLTIDSSADVSETREFKLGDTVEAYWSDDRSIQELEEINEIIELDYLEEAQIGKVIYE